MVNTITLLPAVAALLTASAAGSPLVKREDGPPQEINLPTYNVEKPDQIFCRTEDFIAPPASEFSQVGQMAHSQGSDTHKVLSADKCTVAIESGDARASICPPPGADPKTLEMTFTGDDIYAVTQERAVNQSPDCMMRQNFGGYFPINSGDNKDTGFHLLVDRTQ